MENAMIYQIGGLTISVNSDIPIAEDTFGEKFRYFRVDQPGEDSVELYHHLGIPFDFRDLGEPIKNQRPWVLFKKNDKYIYYMTKDGSLETGVLLAAVFNTNYSRGDIYHKTDTIFKVKDYHSLTFFPTDQILLCQLMSHRGGIMLHSAGVILGGSGLMFIGHSGAGKSTTIKLLNGKAEVLCDDRNIVRRFHGEYRLYGTWSHGEISQVSSSSAPLKAILFLKQSQTNRLTPIEDKRDIKLRLLECIIKSFLTADWWDKSLAVIEDIAENVPCYEMEFDRGGDIVPLLDNLVEGD